MAVHLLIAVRMMVARAATRLVAQVVPLGAICLAVFIAACASATGPDSVVPLGSWGGEHAVLTLDASGASIEFDCAHGTLSTPIPLMHGSFDVAGDYVQEHGGPIREGEQVVHRPARYQGSIDGIKMALTVTLSDTSDRIGSFTLTRGTSGRVFKCL
jgi:hypothetical protein